jgi:ATP-dependent Clp protease ATP-binding subunit ClpA
MISTQLELLLNRAIKRANELKHEFLTIENVLLAILSDDTVKLVLNECGADIPALTKDLEEFVNEPSNFSILDKEEIEELGLEQFANEDMRKLANSSGIFYQPEISLSLQRVIQRAALQIQQASKKEIMPINLIVAMYSAKECHGVFFLKKHNVERISLVEKIAHGIDRAVTNENEEDDTESIDPLEKEDKSQKILDEFTVNLNTLARKGKIDPIIGRSEELQRVIQILCRRRKNNPILVGEAGVGKTAIAEGLAQLIEENKVPSIIQGTQIYSLDMAGLLAGTKFRGDFEERLKNIIKAIEQKNKEHGCVLFIDEIHNIIGAGSTNAGSMDASNLLKPALSRGYLKCMGSTTYDEYRKFFEKDQALTRRFQKIDVHEPSLGDTILILKGLISKFEEHHNVVYSDKMIELSVSLSSKHITDRKLPDKAIDVIDEVGAYARIKHKTSEDNIYDIDQADIEHIVAKIARIPEKTISVNEKDKIKNLERDLKLLIFGQDEAVNKISNSIILSRSGLGDQNKPISSFLFAGPTGVGKTELAKQLSMSMGINFERIDMSEYMEKHSVAKLIGAPPGYVGFDQGGILTEKINQNPYSVLLLDELEKAHPDIFNILLQVMDHGQLTDSNGKTTDFRNVILIMTSNAGAKEMEGGSIGLSSTNTKFNTSKRDQTLKNYFSPEFRNRLDSIIFFNHLTNVNIISIVEKFVMELENQLLEKKVELDVSDELMGWFAVEGYDQKMGARPIGRLINEKLRKPLANELLFGKLENGGKVLAVLADNEVKFEFIVEKMEEIS